MSKFKELKSDVHAMIMKEIANAVSDETSVMSSGETISKCGRLLAHLDEAAIKYLMKLTNDYIYAKRKQLEYDLQDDLNIFKKYGFDAHILDEKIAEIQCPYNADHEMWPNKIQEEIMGIVFSYFECPKKLELPSVDKILEIASKFGATYGAIGHGSSEINWLDTGYFDDPYDTCKYFSTAISNGLSISEIIQCRKELDTYMDYYSAPRMPGCFNNRRFRVSVTSIVGSLEEDRERMSEIRAGQVYEVMNYRLAQENSRLNLQLSSFVPTDAQVTDEATDSHGAKL